MNTSVVGRVVASWGASGDLMTARHAAGLLPFRDTFSSAGALPGLPPLPAPPLDDLPPLLSFLNPFDLRGIACANGMYLLAVYLTSAWVKRRGPVSDSIMKPFMLFYNATCVLLAAAVVWIIVNHKLLHDHGSFACNTQDMGTRTGEALSWGNWLYYAQKYWEFLDTIIFALRGSFRQLTTLHVYHHVSITLVTAAFIRHDVNGDCTLAALANSFIHVLMYSHYFCSAFGLKTPWRKHLTSLQLLQFVGIFAQSTLAWLRGPSCGFPDWMKAMMICYQISMLALFGQFFVGAYAKPKASKPKASAPTPTRRKTRAKAE